MEWNNEEMPQLIDEYRIRPVLWNPTNNLFKNRNKKEDAWKDLAKLFKTDTVEIKRKINSLLASFRREKQKVVLKPSGSGTEEIYKTKWFAFSSFGFLMDKNKPKHTQNTDEMYDEANVEDEIIQETEAIEEKTTNDTTIGTTDKPEKQINLNTYQHESQKRKDFVTPDKSSFSKKTKNVDPLMMEACTALKSISSQKPQRDSFTIYGEYIAEKLRSYDKRTCAEIQHRFSGIIYEADMRQYTTDSFVPRSMSNTASSPAQWSESVVYASSVSSPAQSSSLTYVPLQSPQSQHESNSTIVPLTSLSRRNEMFSTDVDGTYPQSDIATYINTLAEET